jgi:hypothetical protein
MTKENFGILLCRTCGVIRFFFTHDRAVEAKEAHRKLGHYCRASIVVLDIL